MKSAFFLIAALFAIPQLPTIIRFAGQISPFCSSYNEVIKNDLQAIAFAKENAFEPGYDKKSPEWVTVFSSDAYKNPSIVGKHVNGILWNAGRNAKKYGVDFRYDDGEIEAAMFAEFTPCGVLLDRGHDITTSTRPQYNVK
jgi:hypothetical protein